MTPRTRQTLFLIAVAGFATFLLLGLRGLPAFGHYRGPYGDALNAQAPHQRHISNVITAINYDYRGLDTLGEEFILFTSVVGVALLLRQRRGETEAEAPDAAPDRHVAEPSDAVRVMGLFFVGCTIVLGAYVVLHGHLTPGGGFQGGSIIATGWLLTYLAGRHRTFLRLSPQALVDAIDAVGAGVYAVIGLATLVVGAAFLQNILPQGNLGDLLSSGTIWLINAAVGVEVAAGMILVLAEFLRQTLDLHQPPTVEHSPDGGRA